MKMMSICRKPRAKLFFCAAVCFGILFSLAGTTADTVQQETVDYSKPSATYTVCGLKGSPVAFTATSLEDKLNIPSGTLSGIVVTALPDTSDGRLQVDGENVQLYETIGRDGLNRLVFVPSKGSTSGKFCFVPLVPNENRKCSQMAIALLDTMNTAPVAKSSSVTTQKNVGIRGAFKVSDKNGDTIKIVITQKPEKGSLKIDGLNYTYEPYLGMTGTDSFTYKAVDRYGYTSEKAKVSIKINVPESSFSYMDMKSDPNYYAALRLAQEGAVVGQKIGGNYYFEPQKQITKGDFLVMLLSVTGREDTLTATVNTGLDNDTQIPMWLKPYVACAERLGILGGKVCADSFRWQDTVTMTQAVYMIDNSVEIPDSDVSKAVFRDFAAIPSYAAQSYFNLYGSDILELNNGYARPSRKITRSDAAGLLYRLKVYCDSHEDALALD